MDVRREDTGAKPAPYAHAKAKQILPETNLSTSGDGQASPAQAKALAALPHAVACNKSQRAPASQFSYLRPEGFNAPVYRLSQTLARGTSSKVRTVLDENDHPWALMAMHPDGRKPSGKRAVAPTPLASITQTRRLLERVQSPMRPLDEWVDSKGKVYWRVPLKAMDLLQVIAAGPRSPLYASPRATQAGQLFLFREMAQSLVPVHRHGIVHFDVKPENWLVDDSQEPSLVLIDFGSAKATQTVAPGTPRGSMRYMAPEVLFRGDWKHKIDARSDIFSLGMSFLHMATGGDAKRIKGFDPRALGGAQSRVVWLETFELLAGIHMQLAELVMNEMLDASPANRPDAQQIESRIGSMVDEATFEQGQRVVRDQVHFCQTLLGRYSARSFVNLLLGVPARPPREALR